MGTRIDLNNDPASKQGFFYTFLTVSQTQSDNLLMQRQVKCFQYFYKNQYNYNLVFYGVVSRGGISYLIVHFFILNTNTS
jgi:hypothetical protein